MFTNEEADEADIAKDPLAGLDMSYGMFFVEVMI